MYAMLESLLRVQIFIKACSDPAWAAVRPPVEDEAEEGDIWLSPEEWVGVEAVAAVLRPFDEATRILASEPFQPLSLVCPLVVNLREKYDANMAIKLGLLLEKSVSEKDLFGGARDLRGFYRNALREQWLDNDGVYSTQYLVASLLDPRFKSLPFLSTTVETEKAWRALLSVFCAIKGMRTEQIPDFDSYPSRLAEPASTGSSGSGVEGSGGPEGSEWMTGATGRSGSAVMAAMRNLRGESEMDTSLSGGGEPSTLPRIHQRTVSLIHNNHPLPFLPFSFLPPVIITPFPLTLSSDHRHHRRHGSTVLFLVW